LFEPGLTRALLILSDAAGKMGWIQSFGIGQIGLKIGNESDELLRFPARFAISYQLLKQSGRDEQRRHRQPRCTSHPVLAISVKLLMGPSSWLLLRKQSAACIIFSAAA